MNPFSLPSEHLSSHSQAKRHCPSVKQRAVGKERCLLDSHSHSRLDKGRLGTFSDRWALFQEAGGEKT
jgi:hypothetical protein